MKRLTFLLSALSAVTILLATSCGSSKKTARIKPGPFAKTPIVVDGDDRDWPSPYPYYDSKALISYAASNDQENLYLSVKANDRRMMMKLLRGGMKISIDTSGGKDESMFLQSPVAGAMPERDEDAAAKSQRTAETDPAQHSDPSGWRKKMMLGAEQFSISGFGACDGHYATSSDANACGIKVKLGINDYNELVWEAAIPFATWHHRLNSRDAGKPIGICFEIAGMKMPERTYGGGQGAGGHAGGGMRGGGGGMRGGGGGMGHGGGHMGGGHGGGAQSANAEERQSLTQTTRTYLKIAPALH